MTRRFLFIGVSTTQSSIMRIFPGWRDLLRLGDDIEIAGWDLPIHAPTKSYREAVIRLKEDSTNLGALVTTHKIDLYEAAGDLFDEVDRYARLCGEVSCIGKRAGRLVGWAKDPITAGSALTSILGPGYFGQREREVLCFGAGGAGVAITLHLLSGVDPGDRPRRVTVTDRDANRLEQLRRLRQQVESDLHVEYVHSVDSWVNDKLVGSLPEGSVVINATGMGKDTPGSPLTDQVVFPARGIVWELNYRGPRDFLGQARAAAEARGLRVEDGWDYFILGWTAVIEEVFNRPITPEDLAALKREAAFARPLPTGL